MYISYNVLEVYMQCYRNTLKLIWHLPYHQSMLPTCSNAPPTLRRSHSYLGRRGRKVTNAEGITWRKEPIWMLQTLNLLTITKLHLSKFRFFRATDTATRGPLEIRCEIMTIELYHPLCILRSKCLIQCHRWRNRN